MNKIKKEQINLMESNSLYIIKFNFKFEAAHRFVLVPTCKCATPHGHSWGVTLFWKVMPKI